MTESGERMRWRVRELRILRRIRPTFAVSSVSLIALFGCQDLMPHDTQSLFFEGFHRSEVVGMLAGLGTTLAAVPDLVASSSAGQRKV